MQPHTTFQTYRDAFVLVELKHVILKNFGRQSKNQNKK